MSSAIRSIPFSGQPLSKRPPRTPKPHFRVLQPQKVPQMYIFAGPCKLISGQDKKHQPHRASEAYSYVSAKRPDGVDVLLIAKALYAVHLAAEILLLDRSTLVVLLLTAGKSDQNLCISIICDIEFNTDDCQTLLLDSSLKFI